MDLQQLETALDELYGLDPSEFTARRDARATEARKEGDRELAAAVKALRRPSAAASTVNMMARSRADEVGRLIDLGARLREAQAALSGDELRALGRQRQQVVAGLAHEARRLAREAGHPISEATAREVEATFEAALADAAAGEAVRAGRLVRALEHRGMDPVDLEGAVAGAAPAGTAGSGGAGTRTGSTSPTTSGIQDKQAKSARSESAAGTDRSRTGRDTAEDLSRREREQEEERRQAEARAKARAEAEEAAERAEEQARRAEGRRAEAADERAEAERRRAETDESVQRLEQQLGEARDEADRAAAAERAARRALREAEDGAESAAAAARKARAAADALDR